MADLQIHQPPPPPNFPLMTDLQTGDLAQDPKPCSLMTRTARVRVRDDQDDVMGDDQDVMGDDQDVMGDDQDDVMGDDQDDVMG